jgi:hypothetical protein
MTRAEAIDNYRGARAAYYLAARREDEAFVRWFAKWQAGENTNAAAAARLANRTSELSCDLHSAQSALYALDLDPWDVDDEDGVKRTPVGS